MRKEQMGCLPRIRPLRFMTTVFLILMQNGLGRCTGSSSSSAAGYELTAQDFVVQGIEKVEPAFATFEGTFYAGRIATHLPDGEDAEGGQDGNLMFSYYEPDHPTYNDTLVIWLNGGPGCSSMAGCLFENGPVTVGLHPAGYYGIPTGDPLRPNPYAWTNATRMMYVEQPHGTGFSQGPFPSNETELSQDFYFFLQNLYNIFGKELRQKRLYFFGESYAGMYVPSIAHYIHQRNKEKKYERINLAGIGLGNGWADTLIQTPAVIDYALYHGMIDSATARNLHNEYENCKDGSPHQPKPFHTLNAPDECGIMGATLAAAGAGAVKWGAPNTYDVTTWDPYRMLHGPKSAISKFYNNPDIQDAMHVHPHMTWLQCLPGAGRRLTQSSDEDDSTNDDDESAEGKLPGQIMLAHDRPLSVLPYISDLLDDAHIEVLIYNGDRDLSTNIRGSEDMLDHMEWSGADGWADVNQFERGLWIVGPTDLGGYIKKYKNLQFLVVVDSGHLVPFNRPVAALDLITRFLGNQSFADEHLPKFEIKKKNESEKRSVGHEWRVEEAPCNQSGIRLVIFTLIGFILGLFTANRFHTAKRNGYEQVLTGQG